MKRRDQIWLRHQVAYHCVHWILSVIFYAGIWGFARHLMITSIGDAHIWAWLALMGYATTAEWNQHIIKRGYGEEFVDVLDALLDWGSWVFFPMIIIGCSL